MKALVMTEYKKLTFLDVPTPVLEKPKQVLVRIKAASICGSDIHGFDGSTGRRKPPIIMGHEASGIIEAVGASVTRFKIGDRVTFDSTINCGTCSFCTSGFPNLCDNRKVLGVSCDEYKQDGIFAEYALIEEHILYKIPDSLPFIQASLTEPASVAAHAIARNQPILGEDVAVVGSGLIGLLLIKLLRPLVSGRIFVLETDGSRRDMALKCGADFAVDPRDANLVSWIAEKTESHMVDRVFEAVGATSSIGSAIDITRKGGTVVLVGNISAKVDMPLQKIVTRQLTLRGSCAISGEYPTVIKLMASGKLEVQDLISKTAPLSEGQIWFDKLYNREDNLLKVVLLP
ncbi:theronine dehydrogenase-like Zn-dependent dehydrogenase [Sphaerochaeta pleomorpha str. Grapes]|uniref:Theronine dehydrogenase-like Zn-dependent dehydrogenase n=1 Tax=Sphaerochaeta pleomorpha (strain ATCC BAA-1885 / DSM 22778 / Grapes) TaxID=158190 RepID=G8QV17_SPHPG|nr:galactitol-1-phosphate 5-dehydrogenase [Sphaerochaeta pleomorpha]AEV29253.1 theronine dehydrogenase-like Zn-dependent dehydrogenase [Sphaerochaeta pleomorpha str. Grapes]